MPLARTSDLPLRAAKEVALAHGITPDRCDVLQDGHTLVVRLTETLVARVVQDLDGPRQGTEWFARETAIARHLTSHGAPIIPLHPDLPPGPHLHLGYPLNFWEFVSRTDAAPDPREIGRTLRACHRILRSFPEPLPTLAILTESLTILEDPGLFPAPTREMLRGHLMTSIDRLHRVRHQPLHGDAHPGNLMPTTRGLLWTDWEDTFSGPVEWDLASILWNARVLEEDHETADAILSAYGGEIDAPTLQQCMIARAAVMTTWYPILYPHPNEERRAKLECRIAWLESA